MTRTPGKSQSKPRVIADHYRDRITSGDIPSGSPLPSRRIMMKIHGVSRQTADRAVEILAREGLVSVRPRAWASVNPPRVTDPMYRREGGTTLESRMASIRATGNALARDETSKILRAELVPCPEHIAPDLGVTPGDLVAFRERVTSRAGRPIGYSRSYYRKSVSDATPELLQKESIRGGSRELAALRIGGLLDEGVSFVESRMSTSEEMEILGVGRLEDGVDDLAPVPVTEETRIVSLVDERILEVATKVTEGSRKLMFRTNLRV